MSKILELFDELFDYKPKTEEEFNELKETIKKALEHYDQIISADGNEAIGCLNTIRDDVIDFADLLGEGESTYSCKEDFDTIKNYIHQAEAEHRELAELKKVNREIINYLEDWSYVEMFEGKKDITQIDGVKNWEKLIDRLEELCKGSE